MNRVGSRNWVLQHSSHPLFDQSWPMQPTTAFWFALCWAALVLAGCQTRSGLIGDAAPQIRKGTVSIPNDTGALVGSYFCTIGDDWTMDLTLKGDGTFRSELGGMASGGTTGHWSVAGSQVKFSSAGATNLAWIVLDDLQPMDILRYGTNWAFLLRLERERYETEGICSATCLHNIKKKK
jgi:hypothetical protein